MLEDLDLPNRLKSTLVDDAGLKYRDFRTTLEPRYRRVWADIALGYTALAGIQMATVLFAPTSAIELAATTSLAAVATGFFLAYLNNFFHEAAHHNLARKRETNDRLANGLLGWVFGSSIALYRPIHFQHHRALGTTADSENSYFDPLRVRYLVEGLFGLKVLRTLRRYREIEHSRGIGDDSAPSDKRKGRVKWAALSATAHIAIATILAFVVGSPAGAVSWLGGVVVFFPMFGSLRQLLEHRSENARSDVDYRAVDHGKTNRLFGDGPLGRTLGSAGFNRHALHHFEPNVSYTRLRDLDRYLQGTDAANILERQRTTYSTTFLRLLEL